MIILTSNAIKFIQSASVEPLAILQITLTHIDITTTVDGDVVARGMITIVEVSDVDAIRVDADASTV